MLFYCLLSLTCHETLCLCSYWSPSLPCCPGFWRTPGVPRLGPGRPVSAHHLCNDASPSGPDPRLLAGQNQEGIQRVGEWSVQHRQHWRQVWHPDDGHVWAGQEWRVGTSFPLNCVYCSAGPKVFFTPGGAAATTTTTTCRETIDANSLQIIRSTYIQIWAYFCEIFIGKVLFFFYFSNLQKRIRTARKEKNITGGRLFVWKISILIWSEQSQKLT